MGVVYRARQEGLQRVVALKMILNGAYAGPEERARFRTEAEAVARLDHSHIVQIHEVGEAAGRPYFSLEYVEGGSLADALRGVPLPGRQAVELVVPLARAMDYAHQQGVIHRDLKPANVLLTRDGLPKITDFGLAKRLRDEPEAARGSDHTPSGAILGTPSYMAPEQATGKVRQLGPAADVYSLGAILYELVTGRPPFQAASPADTLLRVIAEEPVAPRRLQPKVPRDLETICLKCLEKDPPKRYATAHALADDLQRFLNGEPIQARPVGLWVHAVKAARRRPALTGLLGVSAAATVALLIGGAIYNARLEAALQEARAERVRAEESFQQARQAVDDYFTRVSESRLLQVPGMQPLRQELLEDALKYYQNFIRQRGDDPALAAELARAYYRVGRIHSWIGSMADALADQRQGRALWEKLVKENPTSTPFRVGLAQCCGGIAWLQAKTPQRAEALESYQQVRSLWQDLVRENPNELSFQTRLATVCHDIANLQAALDQQIEAAQSYQQALAILQPAADKNRDAPVVQEYLARLYADIATRRFEQGQLPEALQLYQQAQAIKQKLVATNPADSQYRDLLANTVRSIGLVQVRSGKRAEALRSFEEARVLWQELADKHPEVSQYQERLAHAYDSLGGLHWQNKQGAEALCYFHQAHAIQEKLVDRNRDVIRLREDLGLSCNHLGQVYRATAKPAEALRYYQQACAIRKQLLQDEPTNRRFQSELALYYGGLGNLLRSTGQPAEALRIYQKARDLDEKLVRDYSDNHSYHHHLGGTIHNQGMALELLNRHDEALKAYQEAITHQRIAFDKAPQVASYRQFLSKHYWHLAGVQRHQGRPAEAAAAIREFQELWPRDPDQLYSAASGWAQCVPLVGGRKSDLTAAEQAERRQYADEALSALRQAIAHGYKDLDHLKNDKDLDCLRARKDFQQLTQDLEKSSRTKPADKKP
jgi:serine/threonine-protein kinase